MPAIKVFQIDDYTWMAGATAKECLVEYVDQYGAPVPYVEEFGPPVELSDDDLNRLIIRSEQGDGFEEHTFAEELAMMIDRGATFPTFFASTEV